MGARSLVVHGAPCRLSMEEILWHAGNLGVGSRERVMRACWLVGVDRRGSKTAFFLVV